MKHDKETAEAKHYCYRDACCEPRKLILILIEAHIMLRGAFQGKL